MKKGGSEAALKARNIKDDKSFLVSGSCHDVVSQYQISVFPSSLSILTRTHKLGFTLTQAVSDSVAVWIKGRVSRLTEWTEMSELTIEFGSRKRGERALQTS